MKSDVRVIQRVQFECSYLENTSNRIYTLNSHNYKLDVTVGHDKLSEYDSTIIRFKDLKNILSLVVPNKCFLFGSDLKDDKFQSELYHTIIKYQSSMVVMYPFIISAENLVNYFAESIQKSLDNLVVYEVKLQEIGGSYATWIRD